MSLTFKNLQDKVLGWLDEADDSTRVLANVKEAIAAANAERAGHHPWPFLRTSASLTILPGVTSYTLASGVNTLERVYTTETGVALKQVPRRHADPAVTVDRGFTWDGQQLSLLYTPTASDILTYVYLRQPTELSVDSDLPDIPYPYSRVLIYDALLQLGLYSEDLDGQKERMWKERQQALELDLLGACLDGDSFEAYPSQIQPVGDDA